MNIVRIRNSELGPSRERKVGRRVVEALLYPVFGLFLLIPFVRRWRRRPGWKYVRMGGWVLGAALASAGSGGPLGRFGAQWAGAALLILATLWVPLEDLEAAPRHAEKLGARHTLNGGLYAGGDLKLPLGTPLWLFLTPEEMLVVTVKRPGDVLARYRLGGVEEILLEGESYKPRYVSFAKAPPQRGERPEHGARSQLALSFREKDGPAAALTLEYEGPFARHLAEVAAHTLYQMRMPLAANGVGRQAPEILHVIGREHVAE